MATKKQLYEELTARLSASPPFNSRNVPIEKLELEGILSGLDSLKKPATTPEIERPEKPHPYPPMEAIAHYRKLMSRYIKAISGIKITASSTIVARFYDSLADCIEKQLKLI